MKQLIQNLKTGETILEEIPAPLVKKGHILIKTHRSLVSLGTEKMLVEFGKSNLIAKARQQPEKVIQVLDKIKSDGLIPTLEAVFRKLEEPLPLGYCNAGEVIAVGEDVVDFKIGDRVVSNGPHAEVVCIPKNLVALIPDGVSYEEAAFTVIGSIGLQGIRLVEPTLGETVVVSGLGLIGLITAELLKANGCNVIGYDFDQQKVELASNKGIAAFNLSNGIDPIKTTLELTKNVGADAIIITASTKSNELISQAAKMSRKRGRIVLVGVIGLDINRSDFFEKELTFQVSCSYGPGRYDEEYEKRGLDYPISFVRWTEKRNFEAILNAIEKKRLDVKPLITEQVQLADFQKIYGSLGQGSSIASLLEYPIETNTSPAINLNSFGALPDGNGLAIIGAGNFTKMTMMPVLHKLKANLKVIVSSGGVSGTFLAKKYGVATSSTSYEETLKDASIKAVIITTQHNMHANMAIMALEAGKHVFIEKPLAINQLELNTILQVYQRQKLSITVGFNRRFAPMSVKIKQLLQGTAEPLNIIMNFNAGAIPTNHWTQNMQIGGGRIIGEACHFLDLFVYFTGYKIQEVIAQSQGIHTAANSDNVSLILKSERGDLGVINYFANGNKSYSKERIEVYSQGRTIIMDNFRKMEAYGFKGFTKMSSTQDKGHLNQFASYLKFINEGGEPPIPFPDLINVTQASLAAVVSFQEKRMVNI